MKSEKRMKRNLIFYFIFFLGLLLFNPIRFASAKDQEMIYSKDTTYLYKNKDEKVIDGVMEKGTVGFIKKREKDKLYIQSGKLKGYVNADNVLTGKKANEYIKKYCRKKIYIQKDNVYVYEDKQGKERILSILTKGQTVSLNETEKETYEITMNLDTIGYIKKEDGVIKPILQYATKINEDISNSYGEYKTDEEYDKFQSGEEEKPIIENYVIQETEIGKQIIEYACQYTGNPYVWGGTSLTNGTDCSGFIQSVYKHFGYNLPRTSMDMRNVGTLVSNGWKKEDAMPGDIICYDGHVALYMGNGKIIHAANRKNGIIISKKPDYRTILCVRRIIEPERNKFKLDEESKELLCRIVEAEAGSEDLKGKMLVANVILNRMKSKQFPNTIQNIVYAKKQFSPVTNGKLNLVLVSKETRQAVENVLNGDDFSRGALYFMARDFSTAAAVEWFDSKLTYLYTHGGHEFYK